MHAFLTTLLLARRVAWLFLQMAVQAALMFAVQHTLTWMGHVMGTHDPPEELTVPLPGNTLAACTRALARVRAASQGSTTGRLARNRPRIAEAGYCRRMLAAWKSLANLGCALVQATVFHHIASIFTKINGYVYLLIQ